MTNRAYQAKMQSDSAGPMTISRRAVVAAAVAALIAYLVQSRTPALARSQQIWFAPMDWLVRPEVGFGGSTDYMALFGGQSPDAILSHVNVFKVYGQFIAWGEDDNLRRVFAELKRRQIALALETGMLTATERCGKGVEGYGGDGAPKLATRIAQLGGELAYIAMDEPAFYGHIFSGANTCQADFADIARDAAKNLAAVKAVFPGVRAGDTEPVGPSPADNQIEDNGRWADAFRAATGEPLAFSHADLQWKEAWQAPLRKFAAVLRDRKIPLGVIYNGNDDDTSDKAWVAHAEEHYRSVESDRRIVPDQVVFQSWRAQPSHLFPETDPGAFTYLLKRYLSGR
jgi:hypothetical protein